MMLRMRCYWFLVIWVSVLELFTCAPTTTTISETTKPSVENIKSVTLFPYYGALKGYALEVTETVEGNVTTKIIKTPITNEEELDVQALENPDLPSKYDLENYGDNLRNIQKTALNILALQEIAKKNGKLSSAQEEMYEENIDLLNGSAQNLAKMQERENLFEFENREGLSAWFDKKRENSKDNNKRKTEEERKRKEQEKRRKEEEEKKRKEEEMKKKKQEEEQKKKEEEKRKEHEKDDDDDCDNESIAINVPPEDASLAEAKPVGLAIAGEGGVAASKPYATAVVGPGGMAVARPIGTAIAGISPEDAVIPIYAESYLTGSKPPKGSQGEKMTEMLNKIISRFHEV